MPENFENGGENDIEKIDAEIEKLLENLRSFYEKWDEMNPELQEEFYWVEMEGGVGKDREAARKKLEEFIRKLKEKFG